MQYREAPPPSGFQTRLVFRNRWSACTTAYIISAQGAAKALHHMSMIPYSKTFDLGPGRICGNPDNSRVCVSSHPTIVAASRPAEDVTNWGDIWNRPEGKVVEEPASEGLMFSTRLNAKRLLKGGEK